MKILFYAAAASLLFTSGLSYAKSKKIPDFSGEWGGHYEGCEFNSTDWFKFKQKGKIVGDKLFVYYCYYPSDDKDLPICPNYEYWADDYFIRKGNRLIKYRSFGYGKKYKIDKTAEYIYKIKSGGELPVIEDNRCNTY